MLYMLHIILLATCVYTVLGSIEAFQKLDIESEVCANFCNNTSLTFKACKRGCRLFEVCEWVSTDLSEASAYCKSSCNESYFGDDADIQACVSGCDAALPLAKQKRHELTNQDLAMQSFSSLFNLKNPFYGFLSQSNEEPTSWNHMINSMMNSALQSFNRMNSVLSNPHHIEIFDIADGDSEEIVIIEYANPIINTPHPSEKKMEFNTGINKLKTTLKDTYESNLQTNVNNKSGSYDIFLDYTNDETPNYNRWFNMKSRAQSWWDCMVKKAGLPELLLFLFWVSVSLILVLACLMQFRSSSKLSLNGDLAFITDNNGNLPSYLEPYPSPKGAEKSPYYLASVVSTSDKKVPLSEDMFIN